MPEVFAEDMKNSALAIPEISFKKILRGGSRAGSLY